MQYCILRERENVGKLKEGIWMGPSSKYIERDYTAELKNTGIEVTEEDKKQVDEVLRHIEYLNSLPHTIHPVAARHFDEMVEAFDLLAWEFSGRMQAVIDYENHEARIELECVYLEFPTDDLLWILRKLTAVAMNISFTPLTSGFLLLRANMPYFMIERKRV